MLSLQNNRNGPRPFLERFVSAGKAIWARDHFLSNISQDCADIKINSPEWIEECTPRNAKAMKGLAQKKLEGGMTDIEEMCYAAFESLGMEHEKDFFFEYPFQRYSLDFFFPEYSLCIEANGSFWHGSKEKQMRDVHRTTYLEACGLTVLNWWGPDIRKDVMRLVTKELLPLIEERNNFPAGRVFPVRNGRKLGHAVQLGFLDSA